MPNGVTGFFKKEFTERKKTFLEEREQKKAIKKKADIALRAIQRETREQKRREVLQAQARKKVSQKKVREAFLVAREKSDIKRATARGERKRGSNGFGEALGALSKGLQSVRQVPPTSFGDLPGTSFGLSERPRSKKEKRQSKITPRDPFDFGV